MFEQAVNEVRKTLASRAIADFTPAFASDDYLVQRSAVRAGLGMLRALEKLNMKLWKEGQPELAIGVGVNSRAGGICYRVVFAMDMLRVWFTGFQSGCLDLDLKGFAVDELQFHFGPDTRAVQLHHLGDKFPGIAIIIVFRNCRVGHKS